MGGQGGVDPYNSTQCPFYQRLCGQGSFQGKGAYMPEALLDATQDWILPDTVLSHDLLEGELAGCAADGSLRLYDGNPATLGGLAPTAASLDPWRLAATPLAAALGSHASGCAPQSPGAPFPAQNLG